MKKLLFLTAILFSCCPDKVLSQPCARPFRIVVLGSSTSAGSGASPSDSAYVNRYRKYLTDSVNAGCTVINLALGGTTTYLMQPDSYVPPANRSSFGPDTTRNITKALALAPDGILINFPSNDAANSFTLQEQQDNFLRVKAIADAAGIPVWITTTQPRNFTDTARLHNQQRMRDWINTTFGPDFSIDFWTGLAQADGTILPAYNSGDGVHLNNAGHRILTDRVKARRIHSYLCSRLLSVPGASTGSRPQVYPNPAGNELHISMPPGYSGPLRCMATDIAGRTFPLDVQGSHNPYVASGFGPLVPGSYCITLSGNGLKFTTLVVRKP